MFRAQSRETRSGAVSSREDWSKGVNKERQGASSAVMPVFFVGDEGAGIFIESEKINQCHFFPPEYFIKIVKIKLTIRRYNIFSGDSSQGRKLNVYSRELSIILFQGENRLEVRELFSLRRHICFCETLEFEK